MATAAVSDPTALARELIANITKRRGTGEIVDAAGVPAALRRLAAGSHIQRALLAGDAVLDGLGASAALAGAGVEVLGWPEGRGAGWRELLGLEGPTATMGITVPDLGVAERGTLVLSATAGQGRSIDVVSERHVAVLPASRLRATLGEALAERFTGGARPPSAVSLVSGPSRTSDIEKISTLGAHGALSLHVMVVVGL